MRCESSCQCGDAIDQMHRFLVDPEVNIIVGARRSGKNALMDSIERATRMMYPDDRVVRIDEKSLDPDGIYGAVSFIRNRLDPVSHNHLLTDLSSFRDSLFVDLTNEGYPITVYRAIELCHQLPACEKITFGVKTFF